ncbi:hypothetical protein [Starkeya sp. ORNL1]|uniref:hypothetical protein n=1 Tax=Starkeya sp. ORNL1 TaxID=2709380 RepID=UPI001FEF9B74|nr:hypothetical protein [Starkeya sp. ORNL1]
MFHGVTAALAAPPADWVNRAPEIGKPMQERFEALLLVLRTIASFIASIESIDRPPRPPLQVGVADSTIQQSMVCLVTPRLGAYLATATFINLCLGVAPA